MWIGCLLGVLWIPFTLEQCLEYDSKPPKCEEWISTDGEPVFIEHIYNCSRFWVCEPNLGDCLHECARADDKGALYFDVRYQYPIGPVCDWPSNINCTNKPIECKDCNVWQDCVDNGNGFICIPDCKIDPHCNDDEYCDYPDGGEGNCQKGCRNGANCGNNVKPCGICENHLCKEPECCTDEDCPPNEICLDGSCDFECKTDDDCKPDEYCSNGECLVGCNENSDCTDTSCSTCNSDHQCFNPQCCTDDECEQNEICSNGSCIVGCREDSDCVMNGECAVCGPQNQCTSPECCSDDDCNLSNPICNDDYNCIPGCRKDENCPGFDAICNENYSNCNYCNITIDSDSGICSPGCVSDKNCDGTDECDGFHFCHQEGSTKNLKKITFKTKFCKACEGSNKELGPILTLIGGQNVDGFTKCQTKNLDHPDRVDYEDGTLAIFTDDADKDVLGTCFRANLQGEVTGGKIIWTANQGEWTLDNNEIDFLWSDPQDCKFSCCLDKIGLSPDENEANLVKCKKNCQNDLVC